MEWPIMRQVIWIVLMGILTAPACNLFQVPEEPEYAKVMRVVYRRVEKLEGISDECISRGAGILECSVRLMRPTYWQGMGIGYDRAEECKNDPIFPRCRVFIWDKSIRGTELAVGIEHEWYVNDRNVEGCFRPVARDLRIEVEDGFRVEAKVERVPCYVKPIGRGKPPTYPPGTVLKFRIVKEK